MKRNIGETLTVLLIPQTLTEIHLKIIGQKFPFLKRYGQPAEVSRAASRFGKRQNFQDFLCTLPIQSHGKKRKNISFYYGVRACKGKINICTFFVLFYLKPFPQFLSIDAFAPAVFYVNQLREFYLKV